MTETRCELCGRTVTWVTAGGQRTAVEEHDGGLLEIVGVAVDSGGRVCAAAVDAPPALAGLGSKRWRRHECPAVDARRHGGRTGATHPAVSRVAGRSVRSGSQCAAVLTDLLVEPRTCHELAASGTVADVRPGISANQVGARIGELRARGLVECLVADGVAVTRRAALGAAEVHTLTAAGRVAALKLGGN